MLLVVGCAREVALVKGVEPVIIGTLQGGTWAIRSINGAGVIAGPRIEISFVAGNGRDGRVSGRSGCNSFNGRWRQSGNAIEIGFLATTRMGCPPEIMAMEAKLLAVIRVVRRVYFVADDNARLIAGDGRQLLLIRTASPAAPSPQPPIVSSGYVPQIWLRRT
jgi:heat shock protein HslJ